MTINLNGQKVTLSKLGKSHYKFKGVFIQRIRVYNTWRNKISNRLQSSYSWSWGYSKSQKRIDNNKCFLSETLKGAIECILEDNTNK